MSSNLRISVHGLSKRFSKHSQSKGKGAGSLFSRRPKADDTFLALDDLSFEVRQGDRIGIIGRNGAGKSSLLKILSRVSIPTKGEVRIKGRLTALLEVGTGFDRNASGRTNIYLNAGLHGLSRDEIEKKFDEIVEFSGVGKFIDMPVKNYSSGMYVRLAFAIAAHLEPEILLLDEVLAVGDIAFQQKCLAKVQSLTEDEQRTILFVSHSLSHVAQYCNKVLWLDEGRIKFFGGVTEGIELYSDFMKPESQVSLEKREERRGTQAALIKTVTNKSTDADEVIRTGGDILFSIHYELAEGDIDNISHMLVNLVITDEDGKRIFGTPSDVLKFFPGRLEREGVFHCLIRNNPLKPGVYHYNVGFHINRQLVDKVVDAGKIIVFDGDYYGTGELPARSFGEVCVPYDWSLENSGKPQIE